MKKTGSIALIELDYHPEVLRNTCRIMEGLPYQLRVFTSTKIWNDANISTDTLPQHIVVNFCDSEKEIRDAFNQTGGSIWKNDILLFNTIASRFSFLSKIEYSLPVILRVHNSNSLFESFSENYRPIFTAYYLWKDLSHFLRNSMLRLDWFYRKKLLESVDCFAFPSKSIYAFALSKFRLDPKKCAYLPFTFAGRHTHNNLSKKKDDAPICISIIGKVDRRNRDYELIADSIKRLKKIMSDTHSSYKLELVLLGKCNSRYGNKIIKKLEQLQSDKISIRSFNSYVSMDDFDNYIQKTDFLILPLRINTRFTIYREKYGYTKISGAENDMIKYGKPALVTADYPLEENLNKMTQRFGSGADLAEKIHAWCVSGNYQNIDIDKALESYRLDTIRDIYRDTIDTYIDGKTEN